MDQVDRIIYLPVEQLQRGMFQPRRDFNPDALAELAESLRSHGMIEPIIARRTHTPSYYEIIAGERRWRAAQLACLPLVPCILRDYNDTQAAEVALIENLQRENLNPIETAHALARLLAEFGYTQTQLASIVSQSRAKITNTLRLLSLDPRIQQWLIEKKITEGHGKILAGLLPKDQFPLATVCIQKSWSVRTLENEIKKIKRMASPLSLIQEKNRDANREYWTRQIAEHFNTEVLLEGQKEGWIKIKYYDDETLSGILDKMGIKED